MGLMLGRRDLTRLALAETALVERVCIYISSVLSQRDTTCEALCKFRRSLLKPRLLLI